MKVSVCMITYGHELFIEQAIEGVLMQDCDFEVELIVADDCSPDGTEKIVRDMTSSHPRGKRIKYKKHAQNKGMMPNFVWGLNQCKGKYIALCEGDDFWTDPLKLQRQVDFLEKNRDFAICFHNVRIYNQNTDKHIQDHITREVREVTTVLDLAEGNFLHTPSVVLRNDFIIPDWFKNAPLGDWTLFMIMLGDRKIKKITDEMSVYRVHSASVWSNKTQEKRDELTKQSVFLLYSKCQFPREVRKLLKLRLRTKIKQDEGGFSWILKILKWI